MNGLQCPSCGCGQPDGILCHDCTAAVETMLAAVPQLVEQLDVAISKQAKIGGGGSGGLARERSPINFGALAVRDALLVELALWGGDIREIRRHPKAAEIVSGIGRAVKDAYRAIDRMADRHYLGRCGMYDEGREHDRCQAELWARSKATRAQCPACKHVHDVKERQLDMLDMAKDMLFTVKDASMMIGEVGRLRVTEASIRGYIHRKRLAYRPGGTLIRMGDLLAVVMDESERKSA